MISYKFQPAHTPTKTYILISLCFILLFGFRLKAQDLRNNDTSVLLVNTTIHSDGETIEHQNILIRKGKIVSIFPTVIPEIGEFEFELSNYTKYGAQKILNMTGMHVYPAGFTAPSYLHIGDRTMKEKQEEYKSLYYKTIFPNIYSSEFNLNKTRRFANSIAYGSAFMLNVPYRPDSEIPGFGSLVEVSLSSKKPFVYWRDEYLFVNYPSYNPYNKVNSDYFTHSNIIENFIKYSKDYYMVQKPKDTNNHYESMTDIFEKRKFLFFKADYENEFYDILNILEFTNIKGAFIYGGMEAHKVVDRLKKNKVRIILRPINSLTERFEIFSNTEVVKKLYDEEITFGIATGIPSSYIPYYAATDGIKKIHKEQDIPLDIVHTFYSKNMAEIFRMANIVGTIEEGKHATFFGYSKPLEQANFSPELVIIRGYIPYKSEEFLDNRNYETK